MQKVIHSAVLSHLVHTHHTEVISDG